MSKISPRFRSTTGVLLATTAIFGVATSAIGQTAPEYGQTVNETNPDQLLIEVNETVTGAQSGIFSRRSSLTTTNAGTIRGNGTRDDLNSVPAAGISIDEGNNIVNNSGTISGAGLGITTLFYVATPGGPLEPRAVNTTVNNSGLISGESNDGVRLIGGGTITNNGTIVGGANLTGGTSFADGISMFFLEGQDASTRTSVGSVANEAAGTITGDRFAVILSGGGTINNAGSLQGNVAGALIQSTALNGTNGVGTVTNTGTITGADGLRFGGSLGGASLSNSGDITGTNNYGVASGIPGSVNIDNGVDGTITGAQSGVLSQGGALTINNAGIIRGNGTRDDFNSEPAGGVSISVADNVVNNSGTISGAGFGITTLYFFNPATGLLEPRANNTIVNNSGLISGEINDGVRLIGGGAITNTGTITGGANLTDGTSFADGISMFFLEGQDAATRTSVGSVTNQTTGTVRGDRFGVILSGGGSIDNAGNLQGKVAGVLIQSTTLNGSNGIGTVTNTGTITGADGLRFGGVLGGASLLNRGNITGTTSYGINHGTGSLLTLSNVVGSSMTGQKNGVFALNGVLALDNAGTIRANLAGGGVSEPFYAGVLIGRAGSTVTNSGVISGAGRGITTSLVSNGAGGFVMEARDIAIINSGKVTGETDDAISLLGGGSVRNSGRIEGLSGTLTDGVQIQFANGQGIEDAPKQSGSISNLLGGEIIGARYGAIVAGGGTVNNAGLIEGGLTGLLIVDQARSGTVGSLVNSGTIAGGVLMNVGAGNATNTGTIRSTTGAAFTSGQSMTLTNAGRIVGGGDVAVVLSNADDTLILNTGSDIVGTVGGGDGIDLVRLSGVSDVRTITQVVGDLRAFETLLVEDGYWTAGIDGFAVSDVRIAAGASFEAFQTAPNGAIAVDNVAVSNEGTLIIQVGVGDAPLELDAVSVTGSGTVRLTGNGIVVQSTAGLMHTGGTSVEAGTLAVIGTLGGVVTTSGTGTFQTGNGGTEGDFTGDLINNGSFVFDRTDDYLFGGAFSGDGDFEKRGAGKLTFGGAYAFSGVTTITGGAIAFTGTIDPETEVTLTGGTFDITGASQTIGELSGDVDSNVAIGSSTLIIDQNTNAEFAGGIEGDGELVLTGDGLLNLTGDSSFTGTTTVEGGTLSVNGSFDDGVIIVGEGGTLGGNGTIGDTTIGGDLGPGNSIGRLTVNGDLTFTAASTFTVEADATRASDRVDVTGIASLGGASVNVIAADGMYRATNNYTILTAAGGITGQFGNVTSNLAFLTPGLNYSANEVTLRLSRNDIDFAGVAITSNQIAVANALQSLNTEGTLFNAVLFASAANARAAYDGFSGEALASIGSAVINDGRHVRRSLNASAPAHEESGLFAWGDVVGSWGDADNTDFASLETEYVGYAGGLGYSINNGYISLGVGSGDADYVAANNAGAGNESWFIGAEAAYDAASIGFRAGVAQSWSDLSTYRTFSNLGLAGTNTAAFDAKTFQAYGEVSVGLTDGPVKAAPFAGLTHLSTNFDGYTETGSVSALAVDSTKRKITFGEVGVRITGQIPSNALKITPDLVLAWQRAWGDLSGRSTQQFVSGSQRFVIDGIRIARDSARIEAGLKLGTEKLDVGIGYSGQLAGNWSDHAARATIRVRF